MAISSCRLGINKLRPDINDIELQGSILLPKFSGWLIVNRFRYDYMNFKILSKYTISKDLNVIAFKPHIETL